LLLERGDSKNVVKENTCMTKKNIYNSKEKKVEDVIIILVMAITMRNEAL
jgi:hypothetical protein